MAVVSDEYFIKPGMASLFVNPRINILAHYLGFTEDDIAALERLNVDDVRSEHERQQDQEFSTKLTERRLHRTNWAMERGVENLKKLCIRSAIRNLDVLSKLYTHLDLLPAQLLRELRSQTLYAERFKVDVVKLFITKYTDVLWVAFDVGSHKSSRQMRVWTREEVDSVLAVINNKCQGRLSKLDFTLDMTGEKGWTCPQPSYAQLHGLLAAQPNLVHLNLSHCGVGDDTVAVIGSTCLRLQTLLLVNNVSVSDVGLKCLWSSDVSHPDAGKCAHVTEIDLSGTNVTATGVRMALLNLPLLEDVKLEDMKKGDELMERALAYIVRNHPNVTLNLRKVALKRVEHLKYSDKLLRLLPQLQEVRTMTNGIVRSTRCQFDQTGIDFTSQFARWLPTLLGSTLTSLSVTGGGALFQVDLSLVAQCLPNLIKLSLIKINVLATCQYPILPHYFNKLEELEVYHMSTFPSIALLRTILSNRCLKIFDIGFMETVIPEELIREIIVAAREDHDIFSNIKLLQFPDEVTYALDTWLDLLCLLPENAQVFHKRFLTDPELGVQLIKFITRNHMNITVDYVQVKFIMDSF